MDIQEQIDQFLQIPEIKEIFSDHDIHWHVGEYSQGWYFDFSVPDYEKGFFLGAWNAWQAVKAQAVLKSPVMAFDEWFKKRHEKTGLYEEALCGKDDATYIKHEMNKAFQAGWKEKQAVPEGFVLVRKEDFESLGEFKDLYKRAIISAKKRKNQINWAHVAGLGVGSGRAVDLCKSLGIDPGATNMHVVIEAQEQSHD